MSVFIDGPFSCHIKGLFSSVDKGWYSTDVVWSEIEGNFIAESVHEVVIAGFK